jgi:dephospho-CoA kinase
MLNLKKVAITGTISSGKSTVLSYFRSYGAYTVDSDSLLHAVFSSDTPLGQKIIKLFGFCALLPDGQIDRSYLGEQIVLNKELRVELEKICHPYVLETLNQLYKREKEASEKYRLFVAEVPLLFESNTPFAEWFDVICVVDAKKSLAEQRFLQKGYTVDQFVWRNERQLTSEEKKQRADHIIENNGTLEELREKTKRLFNILVS